MKTLFLIMAMAGIYTSATAQYILSGKITNTNNEPIPGATITVNYEKLEENMPTRFGTSTNADGTFIFNDLKKNKLFINISFLGFQNIDTVIEITNNSYILNITLQEIENEIDEVIIQSTRSSRSISNIATRIEAIELEELDEKTNMRPSNVSMLLHESTGIQVQQTSATTANASVRIQGLDGKYTQLLKDGFANFGNFASGLSILEIPPLDLAQVEIIKGPASTLYGGGAIAGMVNFISKTPEYTPHLQAIISQSHIGQSSIGVFGSGRNKKIGHTILAQANYQKPYDVDKDDFTELPLSKDISINPKLFIYPNSSSTIIIGNAFTKSERIGGDILVINDKEDATHTYFETNNTLRNTSTIEYKNKIADNQLTVKQSFSFFDRQIAIPDYNFNGKNYNTFTDIAYLIKKSKNTFVIGQNFVYDKFKEAQIKYNKNNTQYTAGIYAQSTWDISPKSILETGLRTDAATYKNNLIANTEYFILPRVSYLYKISSKINSRIGGGLGYKTPTLFTEKSENMLYQSLGQLNNVSSERSLGGTADINYKTALGTNLFVSINQLFFITQINNPLILTTNVLADSANDEPQYHFTNQQKPIQSLGAETNVKFIFKENFKLFVGYTYTNAKAKYLNNTPLTLLPTNRLNLALIYEVEDKIKIGLEGYFTDKQYLSNGVRTPSFWEYGLMVEKIFNEFSIYVNAENFTDQRQSNYAPVANVPHSKPTFDEIWNHTEGFVLSLGVKLKL